MQAVIQDQDSRQQTKTTPFTLKISLEIGLYIIFGVLAAGLRLMALGHSPLDSREAAEAIAALAQIRPEVTGEVPVSHNPLMSGINQFIFMFFEASNFSARLSSALAGSLLVLLPLTWRPFLGRIPALSLSLLLALSPVAIIASRTMSGVIWAMLFVMILGWMVHRFVETGKSEYSVFATMSATALLFLSTSTGITIFSGLVAGVLMAWFLAPTLDDGRVDIRTHLPDILKSWSWGHGIMASVAMVLVIGTGFFTQFDALTATGNTVVQFVDGLSGTDPERPMAFILLVALRYDFGLIIFGVVGLFFALSEGRMIDHIFAGWFMWSILIAALYADAPPDTALAITLPAAGLSALLIERLFRKASFGYWRVPAWVIPVHAGATLSLIIAFVLGNIVIARLVQEEAYTPDFSRDVVVEDIKMPYGVPVTDQETGQIIDAMREARINTLEMRSPVKTFTLRVFDTPNYRDPENTARPRTVLIQVKRIDDTIQPVLTIKNSAGDVIAGPFSYEDESRGIVHEIQFPVFGLYQLEVSQQTELDEQEQPYIAPFIRGQFQIIILSDEAADESFFNISNRALDYPTLTTIYKIVEHDFNASAFTLTALPFILLMILIVFLLVGSIWGSRAAWRGLAFGFLIYFLAYGIGLGWQATYVMGDDPREMWQTDPVSEETAYLIETLQLMSRQEYGDPHTIEVFVEDEDNYTLAWLLRDFQNVTYIDHLPIDSRADALIVTGRTKPEVARDYVGQDFTSGYAWNYQSLNWSDFVSWLVWRDTRFAPVSESPLMLWIRKDVYDIETVPEN